MKTKGVDVEPSGLIVTTGSQQALDLLGKTHDLAPATR